MSIIILKLEDLTIEIEELTPDDFNDNGEISKYESFLKSYSKEQIQKALNILTKRQQEIIIYRFGIDNGVFHTIEETATKFVTFRELVRKFETKFIKKLKEM